jgi:hypothetical protein
LPADETAPATSTSSAACEAFFRKKYFRYLLFAAGSRRLAEDFVPLFPDLPPPSLQNAKIKEMKLPLSLEMYVPFGNNGSWTSSTRGKTSRSGIIRSSPYGA